MSTFNKPCIIAASFTDAGRVRTNNEDACLIDLGNGLLVVSDGIGGHQAGELAARIVVQVLPRLIEQRLRECRRRTASAIRAVLNDAIVALGREIYNQSAAHAGLKGMGATVVAALIRGQQVHVAHMGDSRAYLLHKRTLSQLTDDHSIVAILLRDGQITQKEAKLHPARGQLSRHVGMAGEVPPGTRSINLESGDRLLLCTDGLCGILSRKQMLEVLQQHPEPAVACRALVDAANRAGGPDNITAIVANC